MKVTFDLSLKEIRVEEETRNYSLPLFSDQAFCLISDIWLKVGWNQKYPYTFSWLGRPVIQLPEDLIRIQEVLFRIQPDVIIETGVAHGGSLIFYASICKAMGKGRVIGIDIEIKPRNREAIEEHNLSPFIALIEGDSISSDTLSRIRGLLAPGERVMVILDSCHTKDHVRAELEAYHRLVSPGSYLVATDGIMRDLGDVPRGNPNWATDNPCTAVAYFLIEHGEEFTLEQPSWLFNESGLHRNVTYWPCAFLRRLN